MADLTFHVPQQVLFGVDAINRIGSWTARFGKRIIVVTESILYEQGVIDRIQDLLARKQIESIVFDEVIPNATSSCVEDALRLARGGHVEAVIGLGGVRALSAAKCLAMVCPGTQNLDDLLGGEQPEGETLPYLEIPTTCRNPFLLTDEYLLVDARDRTAKIGKTQPDITKAVIIDPKLAVTLPAKYTATTMLDTMLHAIEGYLSAQSNPLSETLFCTAIRSIKASVTDAVKELGIVKHRSEASMAGFLTSLGLTTSRMGLGACLSYAINARLMVPKSWVSSILIPHILEFNTSIATEKIVHIAELLGGDIGDMSAADAAYKAVESSRELLSSLELPARLRDFELALDDLVDSIEMVHSFDMMNYLPRTVSTEQIYEIVKAAY
jgi:alcohol dehydrogenase